MFVSKPEDLKAFCERASQSPILAVDTEFIRERTYRPRLCLIQLSISADDIVAVDPLSIYNLSDLEELFVNPAITKIFHACSQDLEVIYSSMECIPTPIFDTQLAAAFLGQHMQLGYGPLVEAYTGIHLPKTESLTDWTRRPLDSEQLAYAEDDVRYLPEIYYTMIEQLIEKDRLSWIMPEMQALSDPAHVVHAPENAFRHLKKVNQLSRSQLAVARELCIWREKAAEQRDIPRKWVISDELVIEFAKRMPPDPQRLHRIRGAEQFSQSDTESVLHAITVGKKCPADKLPEIVKHHSPTPDQASVLDLMFALLRLISEESGIAHPLIATRDDLMDFLSGNEQASLKNGWRYDLAGKRLEALLSGSCGLTVKDGKVEIL